MKIAFMGDTHGNLPYTHKSLRYAKKNGSDLVVSVGDFGYWDDNFAHNVGEEAGRLGLQVYFVDGNHEHHEALNALPIRDDGFRVLHDNVAHIPRGTVWTWDGVTFMGLGGAHSVDRLRRVEGHSWFREESLTYGQAFEAGSVPQDIDIMVTHDCPSDVDIPGIAGNPLGFPQIDIELAQKHRELLGYVVDSLQPKMLIHGHYHVRYDDVRDSTIIVGLDCDRKPLDSNIYLFDTEGFADAGDNGL